MHGNDLRHLAVQLAALAQHLEQQARDSGRQMEVSAQRFDEATRQSALQLADILRSETREALAAPAQDALGGLQQAMLGLARAGQSLRIEADRLIHRRRLWSAFAVCVLIVGSLLAAASSYLVVDHKAQALERIEYQQELQRLTEAGDLARCGQALCVRLGDSPQPRDDGYYVLP